MTPVDANAARLPAFMDYASLSSGLSVVARQFERRAPVHAYLLTGPRGVGKATFAQVLSATLVCEKRDKPCGHCAACQRALSGNDPDLIVVRPEGQKKIGVDRMREVIQTISRHSFGGGYRVVMIEPVERMTPQAQNCLLKSLEEPDADIVFLLMSHEATALLGTIASRCLRVKLPPWPDDVLARTLRARGFGESEIAATLPRSGGNIGLALAMLSEGESDARSFARQALEAASDADAVRLSARLKEDKEGAEGYLLALEQALHIGLLARTGRLPLASVDMPQPWRWAAEHANVGDWLDLMQAVFQARRLREGQVNWQANADHLMMRILEERTKWQQLLA